MASPSPVPTPTGLVVKRGSKTFLQLGRDAAAVVRHGEHHLARLAPSSAPRCSPGRPVPLHRLRGVDDEVEQHLVTLHRPDATLHRRAADRHPRPVTDLGARELHREAHHLGHVAVVSPVLAPRLRPQAQRHLPDVLGAGLDVLEQGQHVLQRLPHLASSGRRSGGERCSRTRCSARAAATRCSGSGSATGFISSWAMPALTCPMRGQPLGLLHPPLDLAEPRLQPDDLAGIVQRRAVSISPVPTA